MYDIIRAAGVRTRARTGNGACNLPQVPGFLPQVTAGRRGRAFMPPGRLRALSGLKQAKNGAEQNTP